MKYTPNVEMIRNEGYRVITRIPNREIRNELMHAVKLGHLGHLKKDRHLSEIFYHPDHRDGAVSARAEEAAYAASCIAKVLV